MTYLQFLPLAEAKHFLRLETDFTEDDNAIERMIKSALQFIEKRTNYVLNSRTQTYYRNASSGYIDIFDYPVNYVGDLIRLEYSNMVRFDANSITVELGYNGVEDAPEALKECALQMLEVFYYSAEKQVNTTLLPESVMQIINSFRRFT